MSDWKFLASCGVYSAGVGMLLFVLAQPSANTALALPDGWAELVGAVVGGFIGAGGAYLGVRFEHRETARRERLAALEQKQQTQDQLKALLAAELVQIASTVAAGARQMLEKAGQRMAGVLGDVLAYSETPRAFHAMTDRLDMLAPHLSTHLLAAYSNYERVRANHAQWRTVPAKTAVPREMFGMLVVEWEVLLGFMGVGLAIMDADAPQSSTQAVFPECAPTLQAEINRLSELFHKYSSIVASEVMAARRDALPTPPN